MDNHTGNPTGHGHSEQYVWDRSTEIEPEPFWPLRISDHSNLGPGVRGVRPLLMANTMILTFVETRDKIVVQFTVSKILGTTRIQEMGASLYDICHRAVGKKELVIDFRNVECMSSAMIGVLVLLNKMARERNLGLRCVNLGSDVLEVFKICRLDKVLIIGHDDDDQEFHGALVPLPKPPRTLHGRAKPPSG